MGLDKVNKENKGLEHLIGALYADLDGPEWSDAFLAGLCEATRSTSGAFARQKAASPPPGRAPAIRNESRDPPPAPLKRGLGSLERDSIRGRTSWNSRWFEVANAKNGVVCGQFRIARGELPCHERVRMVIY